MMAATTMGSGRMMNNRDMELKSTLMELFIQATSRMATITDKVESTTSS